MPSNTVDCGHHCHALAVFLLTLTEAYFELVLGLLRRFAGSLSLVFSAHHDTLAVFTQDQRIRGLFRHLASAALIKGFMAVNKP